MKLSLATGAWILALAAQPMIASSICPAPNGGSVGGEGISATYITNTVIVGGVVQNNTGCNVLITFGPGGSASTSFPNAAISYDAGADDNLIGILNNSGSTITTLTLTSTSIDIFGFDGDGICGTTAGGQTTTSPGYTFVGGGNPCTNSTDPSAYGGPFTTLTSTSVNNRTGVVTFANGGIPNGGSSWFSLEGPVDLNIVVTNSPEPISLGLIGSGLTALYFLRRRTNT
jgi:hypothetical protein